MRRLGIELTDRCNLRCNHCLRDINSAKRDLDFELGRNILRQAAALGFENAVFTGGEPTLHPQFSDLVREATGNGLDLTVVTNGQRAEVFAPLLREADVCERLTVALSLEAPDEAGFEAIRGKRSYRRFMRTLLHLKAAGAKTRFSVTIGPWNRHAWTSILSLAHKLGVDGVSVATYQPTPHDMPGYDSVRELQMLQEEIEAAASMSAVDVILSYEPVTGRATHQCGTFSLEDINVNYRGELTFCCQLSSLYLSPNPDAVVVADLTQTTLGDALGRQARRIGDFLAAKMTDWQNGPPRPEDRHPCSYCLRVFGQSAWKRPQKAA